MPTGGRPAGHPFRTWPRSDMERTIPPEQFDRGYAEGDPPWVIGEPQPVVAELARSGAFGGTILDAGCGTGEHAIHLALLGYEVVGVDTAANALERARAKAAEAGCTPRFELANALELPPEPRFDTVVDSALFHVFGPADQRRYARSLHRVCLPGAVAHVLALGEANAEFGPSVRQDEIRDAFADGWDVDYVQPSRYAGIAYGEPARVLGVRDGDRIEVPAWLARFRKR
uniref:class I SAM-dependent methyltransferase n=1 Tax=Saccharopolyspora galaxeae TaxID=2781241 RepID=UPI0027DAF488|nr:class I SAM-dependent methyltransferase [Saccharopolyspora sp. HNM0986]